MAGEPGDLSPALESAFCECVPEAVEGPLLLGRPHPSDLGGNHRRVEMTSQNNCRREEPLAVLAGKDQVTDRAVVVIAPTCQELNDVGDQVDVSSLTVLGPPDRAAREARPDANDRLLEIDVIPVEREQFSLAHSR